MSMEVNEVADRDEGESVCETPLISIETIGDCPTAWAEGRTIASSNRLKLMATNPSVLPGLMIVSLTHKIERQVTMPKTRWVLIVRLDLILSVLPARK